MEKKVYVKEYGYDDRPRRDERPRREERSRREERFQHHQESRRPERPERPRRPRPHRPHGFDIGDHDVIVGGGKKHKFHRKMKTKLFTSKKELVEYVNENGEKGFSIDIFKIEDDLYKVVVQETKHQSFEEKVVIEIEEE